MQLIKLAIIALASALLAAASDGDEGDGGGPLRSSPAYPSFLQDEEQWGCKRNRNMCQSCSQDCACKTGRCSWNYVCYDQRDMKGANGCRCKRDAECKSGRCSKGLQCLDKLKKGETCLVDNDCATNACSGHVGNAITGTRYCDCKRGNGCGCLTDNDCDSEHCAWGNGITYKCERKCNNPTGTLPFMVTNVALTDKGPEKWWDYHSEGKTTGFRFLKDVRFCEEILGINEFDILGTEVTPEEFKELVNAMIVDEGNDYNHVLYAIHGFQNTPRVSFDQGHDFLKKYTEDGKNNGYLVIPINWRNLWGMGVGSYDFDRNDYAPPAGEQLAEKFDVFDAPYSTSVVAHSMGNYVFRVFAQNIVSRKKVFQNVFMVAADARSDMFSNDFNPDAPRLPGEPNADENSFAAGVLYTQVDLKPAETKLNGGLAITELTNRTRVVWNLNDDALRVRELFQIPTVFPQGEYLFRKALGKFGDKAKEVMELSYFKDRVTFHDWTGNVEDGWIGTAHGYAWEPCAVKLYKALKFQKGTNPTLEEWTCDDNIISLPRHVATK